MNDIELNKKLINLMESSMSEAAKPDYIDLDKDGDKEETMKKAAKDSHAAYHKSLKGEQNKKKSYRDMFYDKVRSYRGKLDEDESTTGTFIIWRVMGFGGRPNPLIFARLASMAFRTAGLTG